MLGKYVIAYIDDILVYSPSLESHVNQVCQVLQRLLQHQLYVKGKKCKFHQCIISFLVYIISPDGVSIDQSTVAAIINWPTPWTFKDLKQLLGFVNFYSYFILAFSSIAYPLTSLLQGGSKHLAWNPTTDVRSDPDKTTFTTAPILKHPDPSKPFIVKVDASERGVGAILHQRFWVKPKLHHVGFFSRKLSPSELNYDLENWELLAVKLAFEESVSVKSTQSRQISPNAPWPQNMATLDCISHNTHTNAFSVTELLIVHTCMQSHTHPPTCTLYKETHTNFVKYMRS